MVDYWWNWFCKLLKVDLYCRWNTITFSALLRRYRRDIVSEYPKLLWVVLLWVVRPVFMLIPCLTPERQAIRNSMTIFILKQWHYHHGLHLSLVKVLSRSFQIVILTSLRWIAFASRCHSPDHPRRSECCLLTFIGFGNLSRMSAMRIGIILQSSLLMVWLHAFV